MAFVQLVRPGCPMVFGSFASSPVDAVGRADVRHAGARAAPVRRRPAGATARRAVPVSGGNLCASKVADAQAAYEIGQHVPADDPRRDQLRPPRGRLAGGRPHDRLREVRPRRRPVRHGGDVREGHRPLRERAGHRRDPVQRARASTSSAIRTRWPTSRRRSTAPRSPTTTPTSSGWRRARSTPRSGPTPSGSGRSPSTRRRRSTPRIDEELQDIHRATQGVVPRLERLTELVAGAPAGRARRRRPRRAGADRGRPDVRAAAAQERRRAARSTCRPARAISITASPAKGLDATVDRRDAPRRATASGSCRTSPPGWSATAPICATSSPPLAAAGIRRVFVVGGDEQDPGAYRRRPGAAARPRARSSAPFGEIGVPCYPEGHPSIPDDALLARAPREGRVRRPT